MLHYILAEKSMLVRWNPERYRFFYVISKEQQLLKEKKLFKFHPLHFAQGCIVFGGREQQKKKISRQPSTI
jgi:hypothetical protein